MQEQQTLEIMTEQTSDVKIAASVKIENKSYKITSVGAKAFYNCKNVSNFAIYTKKLTAKTVGKNAFTKMGSTKYSKMKVKVPAAKQKSYRKILQNAGVSKKAKIQKLTDK